MNDLANAAACLYHWFRSHNIETEGLKVVLFFPSGLEKLKAASYARMDFVKDSINAPDITGLSEFTDTIKINGLTFVMAEADQPNRGDVR